MPRSDFLWKAFSGVCRQPPDGFCLYITCRSRSWWIIVKAVALTRPEELSSGWKEDEMRSDEQKFFPTFFKNKVSSMTFLFQCLSWVSSVLRSPWPLLIIIVMFLFSLNLAFNCMERDRTGDDDKDFEGGIDDAERTLEGLSSQQSTMSSIW